MGSTNTGRFTDYPTSKQRAAAGGGSGQTPSGGGEGDPCGNVVAELLLDEVERCQYYAAHQDVPSVGSDVVLLEQLEGGRLAVALGGTGEVLGYLPTRFNYLRACIENDWSYGGEVVAALRELTPLIRVTLGPAVT